MFWVKIILVEHGASSFYEIGTHTYEGIVRVWCAKYVENVTQKVSNCFTEVIVVVDGHH